jgi:hypothetical protein
MHKFSWAAFGAQAFNMGALALHFVSPHAAVIIGGVLTIAQAVFPSVSKTVNANAAASAAAQ